MCISHADSYDIFGVTAFLIYDKYLSHILKFLKFRLIIFV